MNTNSDVLNALGAFIAHIGLRQLDNDFDVVAADVETVLRIPQEGVFVVSAASGAIDAAPARARRPLSEAGRTRPALVDSEMRRVQQMAHRYFREVSHEIVERHPKKQIFLFLSITNTIDRIQ